MGVERTAALPVAELRRFVRDADDAGYAAVVLDADSPRHRVEDLYGPLAAARARCPIHTAPQIDLIGGERYRSAEPYREAEFVAILGYDEVTAALNDPRASSAIWDATVGKVWGHTIIGMDGDEHRRYRGLIAQAFTIRSVQRWRSTVIEPVVHGLIDRFAARGRAELVREFHLLFPVYVITAMLGLPLDDVAQFHSWAAETITFSYDMERAVRAGERLGLYLRPLISERRQRPGDGDLLTLLTQAELEGQQLTDEEIISFVRLLLNAGGETTFRSSASLMAALLSQPETLARIDADRSLLAAAIEEGLRWEPPLTSINRLATDDMDIAGYRIRRGTIVEAGLGMANRDPARWQDPHRFDIDRPRQGHVAFGWGPHTCLGAHLARVETEVAVTALLDRCRGLRLDPDQPPPVIRGIGLRGADRIPVVFDPVAHPR